MITYQKYIKILEDKNALTQRVLVDLIYSRGEEKITESLTGELGEILIGIEKKNYTSLKLNKFCKANLGIDGRVLVQRDFTRWNKN